MLTYMHQASRSSRKVLRTKALEFEQEHEMDGIEHVVAMLREVVTMGRLTGLEMAEHSYGVGHVEVDEMQQGE